MFARLKAFQRDPSEPEEMHRGSRKDPFPTQPRRGNNDYTSINPFFFKVLLRESIC